MRKLTPADVLEAVLNVFKNIKPSETGESCGTFTCFGVMTPSGAKHGNGLSKGHGSYALACTCGNEVLLLSRWSRVWLLLVDFISLTTFRASVDSES